MSIVKTFQEMLSDKMSESMDCCYKEAIDFVCPIYGADDRSNPYHIGSCTLIELNGSKILLTAAHVLDENKYTTLYIGLGNNEELMPIIDEFQITEKPGGDRDNDRFDFAWSVISTELESKLKSKRFYQLTKENIHSNFTTGRLFMPIGFPNSRNKKFNAGTKKIKSQALKYSSTINEDDNTYTELGFSMDMHLLLDYEKYSLDEQGEKTHSIVPKGISGGVIVDIGSHSNPESFIPGVSNVCRCVGLLIEHRTNKEVLVATKLSFIFKIILSELKKQNILSPST